MKVRLIKLQTIEHYVLKNAGSKRPFTDWITKVKGADWKDPEDILKTFGSADLLSGGSRRIIFDIGGNNYRMICSYVFGARKAHLFINWIGTHAEYTLLCRRNEQYVVNKY